VTSALLLKSIEVLIKQLAKKLDNARGCAGRCLEYLIFSKKLNVTGLDPFASAMKTEMNRSQAKSTFPIVMSIASIPRYFDHVVEGLIVCTNF